VDRKAKKKNILDKESLRTWTPSDGLRERGGEGSRILAKKQCIVPGERRAEKGAVAPDGCCGASVILRKRLS